MTPKALLRSVVFAAGLAALAAQAQAACYADYKAKRDNPLRLHYGVMEVSDGACNNRGRARGEVSQRLQAAGWQLLNVMSVFGDEGLDRRRDSAAEFFLRF
jgi:hypothetical protein